ncbi:MAG TPA: YIP1 family protein [Anaerolineae bacterium]|nr:YIP1 family protein [Anaerolineae bacterium]
MLTQRIIGAFTFRKGVYAEVEKDTAFTTTAWILVAVVALLNQLGSAASSNLVNWLLGAIVGTIFAVLGFAVGALVINWVGRAVFHADVTFEELVRTLGLAYVWNVVGVLGVLAVISETLSCILAPVMIIAVILMIVAWFIAAKEALDLEWLQTIVTVFLGWLALVVITLVIGGMVLGLLGLGAAAVGGILGS